MGGQSEGTADPSRYERMHTNLNALLTMQPVRHSKQHKALTGAGGLLASSLGCYCPGHCHCHGIVKLTEGTADIKWPPRVRPPPY